MKKISIITFLLLCILTIFLYVNPKKQTSAVTLKKPPQQEVYIGAWVGNFWDSKTKTLNISVLKNFEQLIDKKMAIANIYSEWTYLSDKDVITKLDSISNEHWVPMISSNPHFSENCPDKNESLYKTIASGACDTFLKKIGSNLRSYNKPVFLRFAWEMNLPNMYWGIKKTNSTPQEFVAAWKHFHTILKKEKADNVIWVLSFNTCHAKTIPYADLYPGDEYVDWVAIDGYNWGDSHDWSNWTDFNGVFRNSYNELIAISDKPVMLSEVNSAPSGGDKAKWLQDMLAVQIPEKFPQIKAIIFFNENKQEKESLDWRIEKSKKYSNAVKTTINNKIYKSSFP